MRETLFCDSRLPRTSAGSSCWTAPREPLRLPSSCPGRRASLSVPSEAHPPARHTREAHVRHTKRLVITGTRELRCNHLTRARCGSLFGPHTSAPGLSTTAQPPLTRNTKSKIRSRERRVSSRADRFNARGKLLAHLRRPSVLHRLLFAIFRHDFP